MEFYSVIVYIKNFVSLHFPFKRFQKAINYYLITEIKIIVNYLFFQMIKFVCDMNAMLPPKVIVVYTRTSSAKLLFI